MSGESILNKIYQLLGMFDAHPHSERLLLQRHVASKQHFICITGAVTGSQQQAVAGQLITVVQDYRSDPVSPADDIG